MRLLALTVWYTLAALFGPGVCCCAFAAPHRHAAGATAKATPAPAKPVKTCCHQKAPSGQDQDGHKPAPENPAKCPCERGKQLDTPPPAATASDGLAAQLQLPPTPSVVWWDRADDVCPPPPGFADTSQPSAGPAGRALLAAYSLLRC